MQLSEAEQLQLEEGQEILELNESRAWQLFRKRIESGIASIKHTKAETKLRDWEHYLTLEARQDMLQSVLNDLDAAIPLEIEKLQKKLETEPDNSPATGSLA